MTSCSSPALPPTPALAEHDFLQFTNTGSDQEGRSTRRTMLRVDVVLLGQCDELLCTLRGADWSPEVASAVAAARGAQQVPEGHCAGAGSSGAEAGQHRVPSVPPFHAVRFEVEGNGFLYRQVSSKCPSRVSKLAKPLSVSCINKAGQDADASCSCQGWALLQQRQHQGGMSWTLCAAAFLPFLASTQAMPGRSALDLVCCLFSFIGYAHSFLGPPSYLFSRGLL